MKTKLPSLIVVCFLFSCAESREKFMTYLESFISGDMVT